MKMFSVFIGLLLMVSPVLAFGEAPPEKPVETKVPMGDTYVIDDFESGSLNDKGWWTFDIETAKVVSNDDLTLRGEGVAQNGGKKSLLLTGDATNWYAGGCGVYIAKENQDLSKYNSVVLDIYGNGEGSGTLKIELFDDDNNNWQVEQDRAKNFAPVYDDKLTYDVIVDWKGWKKVEILLDDFVDENEGTGDDVWNPAQKDGSGGLLQLQFVCLAAKDKGTVNFNVDNVSLSVSEE
jgi:hypothetical protein